MNRRCKYHCMVEDAEGIPSFTIRVEDDEQKEQLMFRGKSPRGKQSVLQRSWKLFVSDNATDTTKFDFQ